MDVSDQKIKVLFSRSHRELLGIGNETEYPMSSLQKLLCEELDYSVDFTDDLTAEKLSGSRILVLGAPVNDLTSEEPQLIQQFVENGGGLLILTTSEMMEKPLFHLSQLTRRIGIEVQKYHNYPPTYLQVFHPHSITANLKRIKVKRVAFFKVQNGVKPVAFTKKTLDPVVTCVEIGQGRVITIGDAAIFGDVLLDFESNRTFAANTFHWLAFRNIIEIDNIEIPKTVEFGKSGIVVIHLRNNTTERLPKVRCILQSDADAVIDESLRERLFIPLGKTTLMQWSIKPKRLGEQHLRVVVDVEGQSPLFFDQLPEMCAVAPGYLTLEIRDKDGRPQTHFATGEHFTVEGAFHASTDLVHTPYHLELKLSDGLAEYGHEQEKDVWHVKALKTGTHNVTLRLTETTQELPAMISVKPSTHDRIAELYAAYVYPLDAEISERLRRIDERFYQPQIRQQPFQILLPEDYVQRVHDRESAAWLQGVLTAAHREQWYNLDLLNIVLKHIAPTYLPNIGSFIPYDPELASHLAQLHSADKKHLEYNLLCLEESEEIDVKQNIAAYLLHEKYGHGFFYAQTCLGRQLALLKKHGLLEEANTTYKEYKKVAELLRDSSIIVNEGFGAWMEITFLSKLADREVRQAADAREKFLIEDAKGLFQSFLYSDFFDKFPPRFDSRYREGFEYLEYISKEYNVHCALQAFLIATRIDFGITGSHGEILFGVSAAELERRLLEKEDPDWHCHVRLRQIAELLLEHEKGVDLNRRKQYCRDQSDQLANLIQEKLGWRYV